MVKQLLYAGLAGAILGASAIYYLFPQIEEREVMKQEVVVRNQIRTVIKTVERPDGTKETVESREDNSTSTAQSNSVKEKKSLKNWQVAALATTQLSNLTPAYGALVQRRVLGPLFVGVLGKVDGEFGLSVGMEF